MPVARSSPRVSGTNPGFHVSTTDTSRSALMSVNGRPGAELRPSRKRIDLRDGPRGMSMLYRGMAPPPRVTARRSGLL